MPKSEDIDVFLEPLVKQLKDLRYDGVMVKVFNMRVSLKWTMDDFLAYRNGNKQGSKTGVGAINMTKGFKMHQLQFEEENDDELEKKADLFKLDYSNDFALRINKEPQICIAEKFNKCLFYEMSFRNVRADMRIAWEEPFGHVLPVIIAMLAIMVCRMSNLVQLVSQFKAILMNIYLGGADTAARNDFKGAERSFYIVDLMESHSVRDFLMRWLAMFFRYVFPVAFPRGHGSESTFIIRRTCIKESVDNDEDTLCVAESTNKRAAVQRHGGCRSHF
ncbi:hypothetical protein FRX31_008983 [Thalictrum thalictroides]|uniref:Uncharacterized protein n=1 Tax=Thalictrum thalictroides TaxID=46969 RepID=A0A7J6WVL8_THATH|nr:hypothetical protein FRX31_008983 [Thalictrum thalictroides]